MRAGARARRWLAAIAATLAFSFSAPIAAAELTVSAAASLAEALTETAHLYESAHPGTRITINTGASGALLQQIIHGAPVDLLVCADEATMDRAQAAQLIDSHSRSVVATNALVVVVPKGASRIPHTLADLAQPDFTRITIGQPAAVPAGHYAQSALVQARLWSQLEPKWVMAQHVRQVLDYVARGEVDAGFVYASDAALQPDRVQRSFNVSTPTQVRYSMAVLRATTSPQEARAFASFMAAPAAQAVLRKHGFGAP